VLRGPPGLHRPAHVGREARNEPLPRGGGQGPGAASAAAPGGAQRRGGRSFFLQFGSQDVRTHSERAGMVELIERMGVQLIDPGCGAWINAGPRASTDAGRSRSAPSTGASRAARIPARSASPVHPQLRPARSRAAS
jgi:hypothetical protein